MKKRNVTRKSLREAEPLPLAIVISEFKASPLQAPVADITTVNPPPPGLVRNPVPFEAQWELADIRSVHGGADGLIYIQAVVKQDWACKASLAYGADGPVKAWVNGIAVDCRPEATNPASIGEYVVPISWKKGANRVCFALATNHGKAWGVQVRVVDSSDFSTVSDEQLHTARHVRLKLLREPYRPAYHFVAPEGLACPFDPNGNVYWRGRHHMGYIYQEHNVHYWGHVSSIDLLHWVHHQPYLVPTPDSPEVGIFSGNSYLDKHGKRVICLYHGVDAGNCIAWSDDKDLARWHKQEGNPIVPNPTDPEKANHTSWDPCGWIHNGTYYAVFGGQKNTVWKSKDLRKWTMCGPFLAKAYPGIDLLEDISCPDFFKLGKKWVMVCISHRLGARYYVGQWKNEQFYPEYHEMMSHCDNQYFAPESHTDGQGRRILFAWVFDGRNDAARGLSGWSGMMSLPRVMTLGSDNRIIMTPAEELKTLRYNETAKRNVTVPAGGEKAIAFEAAADNVLELELELTGNAAEYGIKVCCSDDGREETVIGYNVAEGKLKIDTTRASSDPLQAAKKSIEAAPLKLGRKEALRLRVFVDRCMVEVFANDGRLALSRVVSPSRGSTGIKLYARGGSAKASGVRVWDMMPTNPY